MSIDERNTKTQSDELSDDALEAVAGGVAGLSGLSGLGGDDIAVAGSGGTPKPVTEAPLGPSGIA